MNARRQLILCLLLGALTTIGVAWSFLILPAGGPNVYHPVPFDKPWPVSVPAHWPKHAELFLHAQSTVSGGGAFTAGATGNFFEYVMARYGGPFRSFRMEYWVSNEPLFGLQERHDGVRIPRTSFGPGRSPYLWLPIRPIWPGFLADTVFFGALFWCGSWGWRSAVRFEREIRQACLHCGFSRRGLRAGTPCPECGNPACA